MKEFALMALGIAIVLASAFTYDMVGNHGKVAAQHIHHAFPECSNQCHGQTDLRQNAAAPASELALPNLQDTHRPMDSSTGPWRYPLLGVQMETGRGY